MPSPATRQKKQLNAALVDQTDNDQLIDLVRRTAQNDEIAFARLYERLAPALYGLTMRLLGDAKEAEDVLQEGFTYIWRRAASYDPARASVFAWSVLIIRNKAIDRLRARHRTERLQDRVSSAKEIFAEWDDVSALEPQARERRALVHSALNQISAEQREAVELAFFGGLTHDEIAERLAAPLGTIKARIRRGLLKLRSLLEGGL